ncbi:hypothetical protein [Macrococcus capreoli]|uniref:hypothetical protein n=1 Tax=Macrococcus capreoli TaxID=2982690 RepID=UPI0021D5F3C5|nr:hypothetical protein [Macrococcus sp. TMW 2.2395]MCU7556534.1 hypothetical protein [Macrococcus sp. TMW 2.2395]
MKISIKMRGDFNRLRKDISKSKVTSVLQEVDQELGKLTYDTVKAQAERAPVDTGWLRENIQGSASHAGSLHWQILSNIDAVPYYWRQNFEHKTKRYFITIPVNQAEMQIVPRLQRVVDSAW